MIGETGIVHHFFVSRIDFEFSNMFMLIKYHRWGSFANGEEGFEELDTPLSYRLGLKTWANWVDSTIDPNRTRVFFTTMSPTHQRFVRPYTSLIIHFFFPINTSIQLLSNPILKLIHTICYQTCRSADWGRENGTKCFNETKPVMKKWHWGSGSDLRMMNAVSSVVQKMKVPVTFINITQLSEYRIDAHSSIYTELGGELLSEEQKADPLHFADCIHWCLPGVPDTWNRIFYAHL